MIHEHGRDTNSSEWNKKKQKKKISIPISCSVQWNGAHFSICFDIVIAISLILSCSLCMKWFDTISKHYKLINVLTYHLPCSIISPFLSFDAIVCLCCTRSPFPHEITETHCAMPCVRVYVWVATMKTTNRHSEWYGYGGTMENHFWSPNILYRIRQLSHEFYDFMTRKKVHWNRWIVNSLQPLLLRIRM